MPSERTPSVFVVSLLTLLLASCAPAPTAPAPQTPAAAAYPLAPTGYAQTSYPASAPSGYAPAASSPYPSSPYPSSPYPAPVAQAPAPAASAVASRPILAPLVGSLAWQAETRGVIAEDTAALTPDNQARVRGIPLVFDPNPYEINAYAACDPQGNPGIVGTEGLLEAIDAIAQTRATDELYGTQTYARYLATVVPALASSNQASAGLPVGLIPANLLADPRRWSRAHEWFDEIVAFTFGHELSHHWLGHTGCASGSLNPLGMVQGLLSRLGPTNFTQPAEFQADTEGTNTMLAAGRARLPQYRWNEEGGLALLDFFLHLEQASAPGMANQIKVAFLGSHPPSALRIPIVQATARIWYAQHPG